MASQIRATTRKRIPFSQSAKLNAELVNFPAMLAAQQNREQRAEDVRFRKKKFQFDQRAQEELMGAREAAQKAALGTEIVKTGINVGLNPNKSGLTFGQLGSKFGSLFGGGNRSVESANLTPQTTNGAGGIASSFGDLNISNVLSSGAAGFGAGMFGKSPISKVLLGAGIGGGLSLLNSGLDSSFGSIASGLFSGGLGGALSSLFK
jgi:hypothetical protein